MKMKFRLAFFSSSLAFFFSSHKPTNPQQSIEVEELSVLQDDLFDALVGYSFSEKEAIKSTLDDYSENPLSCFQQAASKLTTGCSMINNNEYQKVTYAIHLSLCEISTGDIPLPSKCLFVLTDVFPTTNDGGGGEVGEFWNIDALKIDGSGSFEGGGGEREYLKKQKACVNELARVPQLWTSYAGYLKQVVNMCYSVSHKLSRYFLTTLHKNLTRSHLKTHQTLAKHHLYLSKMHQESQHSLEKIENSQSQVLKNTKETLDVSSKNLHNQNLLSKKLDEFGGGLKKVETDLQGFGESFETEIGDVVLRLKKEFGSVLEEVGNDIAEFKKVMVGDVDLLQTNVESVNERLALLISSIDALQVKSNDLDQTHQQLTTQSHHLLKTLQTLTAQTMHSNQEISTSLSKITQTISKITKTTTFINQTLAFVSQPLDSILKNAPRLRLDIPLSSRLHFFGSIFILAGTLGFSGRGTSSLFLHICSMLPVYFLGISEFSGAFGLVCWIAGNLVWIYVCYMRKRVDVVERKRRKSSRSDEFLGLEESGGSAGSVDVERILRDLLRKVSNIEANGSTSRVDEVREEDSVLGRGLFGAEDLRINF